MAASYDYTIHNGAVSITIPKMTSSHSFCGIKHIVKANGTLLTDGSMQKYFTFDNSTMKFTITIDDNVLGNQDTTISIKGVQDGDVTMTVSFNLHSIKNCVAATLVMPNYT